MLCYSSLKKIITYREEQVFVPLTYYLLFPRDEANEVLATDERKLLVLKRIFFNFL